MNCLFVRTDAAGSASIGTSALTAAVALRNLARRISANFLAWGFASLRGCSRPSLLLGLVVTCFSILPVPVLASVQCQGAAVVEGVDVDSQKGLIDWNQVAASGRKFAIAKTSEGLSFVDPMFDVNYQGIKTAGMVRGSYHFFRPGQDATAQAQLVLAILSKYGPLDAGDLVPVLDVEVTDGQSPATIAAGIATWVAVIKQATGRNPIIYTGASFWNSKVASLQASGGTNLWVANWGGPCPNDPSAWSNWLIWQYSAVGSVPGISGAVFLDRFNGAVVTDNVPPAGFQVKPTITITSPNPQNAYVLNQIVVAGFACSEAGDANVQCQATNDGAPIINGGRLNSSTAGGHVLAVSATDSAGVQSASQAVYAIRYAICALYDQAKPHEAEATIHIEVQLCDVNQQDASNPATALVATQIYQPMNMGVSLALNEPFRFEGGAGRNGRYKLDLKTSSLVPGLYVMNFLAGSDPVPYQVQFVIRNDR